MTDPYTIALFYYIGVLVSIELIEYITEKELRFIVLFTFAVIWPILFFIASMLLTLNVLLYIVELLFGNKKE